MQLTNQLYKNRTDFIFLAALIFISQLIPLSAHADEGVAVKRIENSTLFVDTQKARKDKLSANGGYAASVNGKTLYAVMNTHEHALSTIYYG